MAKITLQINSEDLNVLYPFFFAASLEGKSNNDTFNRMFLELDKHARSLHGSNYNQYINLLRNEVLKQKNQHP